jgi:ribosomal protein S18 acetylase RimI-like enzyme
METKIFGDKKILIRKLSKGDLKKADEFLDFFNSLISEEAKLLAKKKINLREEEEKLKGQLNEINKKVKVWLVAEDNEKIVGITSITLVDGRGDHIGKFSIAIKDSYRGVGLGKYLMLEIIRLAKNELKPKPKFLQLEVYVNNRPAVSLYKKMGFKIVARIPKQRQWKGKLIAEFVMQRFL